MFDRRFCVSKFRAHLKMVVENGEIHRARDLHSWLRILDMILANL